MARSVLKRLVSQVGARFGITAALIGRNGQPTILYYHRVVEKWEPSLELALSVEAFEAQVAYLAQRCKVVSLDEVESHWRKGARLPPRSVAVTFDDGYQDNYRCAFPILKRYGVPAGIFLTTAHMGNKEASWWDRAATLYGKAAAIGKRKGVTRRHLALGAHTAKAWVEGLREWGDLERCATLAEVEAAVGPIDGEALPAFLGWEEIHEMAAWGITMGSHTRSHQDLTCLDPEELEREVRGSKEEIETRLGRTIRFFSYPFGRWNDAARAAVATGGYALALAGQHAVPSIYSVPRRKVKEAHTWGPGHRFSPALFEAEISGILDQVFLRGWR